jgi:hypothetical protein
MKEYAKSLADDDVSAGQGISYVLWVMYVCGCVMLMNECLVLYCVIGLFPIFETRVGAVL